MPMYVMDEERRPVKVEDPSEWADWMGTHDAAIVVGHVVIQGVLVSTIFTGADIPQHEAAPKVFETLVRYTNDMQDQERYSSWEEAKAGHARIVAAVLAGITIGREPRC